MAATTTRPTQELHYLLRFRMMAKAGALVILLAAAKYGIDLYDWDILALNRLYTSAIAGAIFIIGFLLASLLSDYKEAEAIPTDVRVALEAIHDDASQFALLEPRFDMGPLRALLVEFIETMEQGLGPHGRFIGVPEATSVIDRLSPHITQMQRLGMSTDFIVRLRNQQDVLRRRAFRAYYFQRMEFVPSVHVLAQTMVIAIIGLLLFLETDGALTSALISAFIAYMLIYALVLIRSLEMPFYKGGGSVDDVSFFLLREFASKIEQGREIDRKT